MSKAASGNGPKRDPITVKTISDPDYKYEVVDGNTTLKVCKEAGWKAIPAFIEELKDEIVKESKKSKPKAKRLIPEPPADVQKQTEPEKPKNRPDLAAAKETSKKIDQFLEGLLA